MSINLLPQCMLEGFPTHIMQLQYAEELQPEFKKYIYNLLSDIKKKYKTR